TLLPCLSPPPNFAPIDFNYPPPPREPRYPQAAPGHRPTLSREAGKRTDSDIVLSSHSDPLRIPRGSPRTPADRISISWSPEGLSVARYWGLQPTLMGPNTVTPPRI